MKNTFNVDKAFIKSNMAVFLKLDCFKMRLLDSRFIDKFVKEIYSMHHFFAFLTVVEGKVKCMHMIQIKFFK